MKTDLPIDLAEVMDLLLNAVCLVDEAGHIMFVNAAFEQVFGYTPDEILGTPVLDLVLPDDRAKTLGSVSALMEGVNSLQFENRWTRKDGQVVHVLWTARWSNKHRTRVAVAHDITERKERENKLAHLAEHDQLTNLPNRAFIQDCLSAALNHARQNQTYVSLLFIDIDGFKPVNDTHGHAVGDALLQQMAQRLSGCVRLSDTVGRLGGDEFLVLLNGVSQHVDAERVAENIRVSLNRPFAVHHVSLQLSPSIGIAHFPEHGGDEKQLTHNADHAMYCAKNAGGNRVVVFSSGDVD